MSPDEFEAYVNQASWRFAKSVPNWPHFYIVEKELPDQETFRAARSFIRDSGRDGSFYDMKVRYYDTGGWTYWASPLAEPLESQYMLNRCKTDFSYESLAASGELPAEGFQGETLNLSPVLNDPEFRSLVRDTKGGEFNIFDVLGTADYEIRHSNVLSWLLAPKENHGKKSLFLDLLWKQIMDSQQHDLPALIFDDYTVDREGSNEEEKIDLLLIAANRTWLIVIENKLFSTETGNQLDRYYSYVEQRYSDVPERLYFYLTPHGIAAQKDEDASVWLPISYQEVKVAVSEFVKGPLPTRIEDFLKQYLVHIERNVLKNTGMIERMRNVLRRNPKIFHALEHVFDADAMQVQCSDAEINLLQSILAVQQEVEKELFEFTKQLMAQHGYKRFSGLGHWITIEIPELKQRLIQSGVLSDRETSPILFVFHSTPHSYYVGIWIYKKAPLYSRIKRHIKCFSAERPTPGRGDEHLVDVVFYRTLIPAERILQESISELKKVIADYFSSKLEEDLSVGLRKIEAFATQAEPQNKTVDSTRYRA